MIICGLDPGTATTGYGIIKVEGDSISVIDFGLIETAKGGSISFRLLDIHEKLNSILSLHNPDIVAIERLFFATNAKTAINVGQAQGVMFLSAQMQNKMVVEYAPGTIKKMVSGSGRADKKEVQKSVRKFLGAKVRSKKHGKTHFDNAADALAVALCHAFKNSSLKGGES